MAPPFGLTDQQRRYADGLLKGKTQRDAYISAGYKARGATADAAAARLLRNVRVAAYLEHHRQKAQKKTEITVERVLRELAAIGFSNVEHYETDEMGRLGLTSGAPRRAMRAVSSVKRKVRTYTSADGTETTVETEYRLWDKNTALANIGKHLGMFTERTVNIDIDDLTLEELERIANGEDPISVLADTRASGDRAA